jgi:tetratricopeptide (TPR) repeat protein
MYRDNVMETDARRVLARVRYYHPEDIGLLELASGLAATLAEREHALRELVRLAPDKPQHALDLADFLVGQGKQEEARPLLQKLAGHAEASVRGRAHYELARSYYRRDELREALEHLHEAEKTDPDSVGTVRARILEGQTYEELGKPDEAARAYRGALERNPRATFALRALIRLARRTDDRPTALRYLRLYSVAVGDDLRGLQRVAETYRELGRLDDALELALRAREQRFHAGTQRILGLIYLDRGEPAKAASHLEKADADAVVIEARLRAHLLIGDVRGLQDDLAQAGRLTGASEPMKARGEATRRLLARRRSLLAALTFPAGKEDAGRSAVDALVCAEQAFAEGLGTPAVETLLRRSFEGMELGPAFALRGRLALGRGQLTQAREDAERAFRLGPPEATAYLVRGVVLLERDRPGAVEALEKAAELSKRTDAGMLYQLARAFHQAGRHEEARKVLREALARRPKEEGWERLLKAWQGD